MNAVGRFFAVLFGWIPRTCRSALRLTGEERQTLMSWGLLLGVVALTAVKLWSQRQLLAHWNAGVSAETEKALVEGLFSQLFWDTMLQMALAVVVGAIARGGSMAVSVTKGGLTIDFQASGQAAKQLATDTTLSEAMSPQAPAPTPAPEVSPKPV